LGKKIGILEWILAVEKENGIFLNPLIEKALKVL
jgi:hypothetical protein